MTLITFLLLTLGWLERCAASVASVLPNRRRRSMQNFSLIPIVSPTGSHISRQAIHSFAHSGMLRVFLTILTPSLTIFCQTPHITPYAVHKFRHSGLPRDFVTLDKSDGYFIQRVTVTLRRFNVTSIKTLVERNITRGRRYRVAAPIERDVIPVQQNWVLTGTWSDRIQRSIGRLPRSPALATDG